MPAALHKAMIAYYAEMYRIGDSDDAIHGLMEMGRDVIPELASHFRVATDVDEKALVLHALWQYRDDSAVPILQEALAASERPVWQEALDGLVALASPTAIAALRAARTQHFDNAELRDWIDEAISQARGSDESTG